MTSGDWTRTGGGDHPTRNTWKGYEHVMYWLLRMCRDYLKWWSLSLFLNIFLFSFLKRQQEMSHWIETVTSGQKGQTRGTVFVCVADVREETKETDRWFFNDLWWLNQDRGRGSSYKEYLERVRARDVLVASYVSLLRIGRHMTSPQICITLIFMNLLFD
jgi:hypothetical protein